MTEFLCPRCGLPYKASHSTTIEAKPYIVFEHEPDATPMGRPMLKECIFPAPVSMHQNGSRVTRQKEGG